MDDFNVAPGASLAIVSGTFRLGEGGARPLLLSGVSFGDLGTLSGDPSLKGSVGFYYSSVAALPEPGLAGFVLVVGLAAVTPRRRRG